MNVSVEKEREWRMKIKKNKRVRNVFVLTISVLLNVCVMFEILLERERIS